MTYYISVIITHIKSVGKKCLIMGKYKQNFELSTYLALAGNYYITKSTHKTLIIRKMGKRILEIVNKKLRYFNYADNTCRIYVHYIDQFLGYVGKPYQHLTGADFQSYLDGYSFKSVSQQNQVISSIKFLYEKVLMKKYNKINITDKYVYFTISYSIGNSSKGKIYFFLHLPRNIYLYFSLYKLSIYTKSTC